jgi:hypothetical protein
MRTFIISGFLILAGSSAAFAQDDAKKEAMITMPVIQARCNLPVPENTGLVYYLQRMGCPTSAVYSSNPETDNRFVKVHWYGEAGAYRISFPRPKCAE